MRLLATFLLLLVLSTSLFSQNKVTLFEPNIFNGLPNIRDIAISPSQEEIYFTIDDYKYKIGAIACIKRNGKKWTEPKIVSFSGNFRDIEPSLSADGNRLYFASNRPLNNEGNKPKDYDIWYVERKNSKSKWSSPKNIGIPVNTNGNEFYPSVTRKGDIYFTSDREGTRGKEDIFVSRLNNGLYTQPQSISEQVNTENYEFNAFVSPGEDFIIFTSIRKGEGSGKGDLYISYRNEEDEWSKSKLIKGINSLSLDYCPFVDMSNSKLYFTSSRSNIKNHYVKKLTFSDIIEMYNQEPAGKSRLYVTEFDKNSN